MPAFIISLLLELHAADVRLREVLRILEDVRHDEVIDAFVLQCGPVLREHRVRAVRHAVAAEIARPHPGRQRPQRSVNRLHVRRPTAPSGARAVVLPLCDGVSLPRRLDIVSRCRASLRVGIEVHDARLRAGVRFDDERRVVLPEDVEASGQMHQPAGAICAALLGRCFVLRRIPGVGRAAPFGVDRHIEHVALRRRHHAPPPVVGDERHPVAGEIDRRRQARNRRRSLRRAAAPALRIQRNECASDNHEKHEHTKHTKAVDHY